MNGRRVALQHLAPEKVQAETDADAELTRFAAAHDGIKVLRPHHFDEPWRAEIREGKVPGESRTTSGFLVADWPSGLLAKLEELFPGSDPEDSPG